MTFPDYFWLAWLIGGLVVAEGSFAIFKREWTLSRRVWPWFGIGKNWKEDYAGWRWLALAGLGVSILMHFLAYFSATWLVLFAVPAAWSIWYYYNRELRRE